MTRRLLCLLVLLSPFFAGPAATSVAAAERPNILWITSEDNSPYLGCYGDEQALTPRLDRLAAEGVRYRNAFANAPVCSTARTTLITGMYGCSLGVQHHRSRVAIPNEFKLYPEHLRAAGYYCANNSKTDYNVANVAQVWNDSSAMAHYNNRSPGQPFFAVFNLTSSHESQVAPKKNKTSYRIPPEKIKLPPYHPDTPELRHDWANYYDQMTIMDQQVGKLLDELEKSGDAENTIVFYYSDHGGALPRGKRNIHDTGTRVPMIVRFPPKYAKLAPVAAGEWVEQPVSFVDLPPTVFSLTGVPIPKNYQGKAFLGPGADSPRDHVFLFRGRMDERYDNVRAIRDRNFRYVRNYSPQLRWGQHYSYPFRVMPGMGSWFAAYQAGKCNPAQAAYWKPKPSEELYDIAADPHELNNLADDPAHAERLNNMRRTLEREMLDMRDVGFIPEGMFVSLAGGRTIYDYAHSEEYPLERIISLANLATSRDPVQLPKLQAALADKNPVIRYWGALGCRVLEDKAAPAKEELQASLADEAADVRIAAAQALAFLDEAKAAEKALADIIANHPSHDPYEVLAALNTLDEMVQAGQVPLAQAQALVKNLKLKEPADRIPTYLLSLSPASNMSSK